LQRVYTVPVCQDNDITEESNNADVKMILHSYKILLNLNERVISLDEITTSELGKRVASLRSHWYQPLAKTAKVLRAKWIQVIYSSIFTYYPSSLVP
jgi:hypothetical protein